MVIRKHFEYRETITTIIADKEDYIETAKAGMIKARLELEHYLSVDPFFCTTFLPVKTGSDSLIVKRMTDAAFRAGVGPMAAVAGSVAWAGMEAMKSAGAEFGIIDNGGDIALISDRPVRVGLYAGDSPLSCSYGFVIPPQAEIYGICTSSATVGHSLSLGTADSVTVFSKNVSLADAAATAFCNKINTVTHPKIEDSEISGYFAVIGDWTCKVGTVPDLVAAKVDENLITAGI